MNDLSALSPQLATLLATLPPPLLERNSALIALGAGVVLVLLLARTAGLTLAALVIAGAIAAGLPAVLGPDDALAVLGTVLGLLIVALSAARRRRLLHRRGRTRPWTTEETKYNEAITRSLVRDPPAN